MWGFLREKLLLQFIAGNTVIFLSVFGLFYELLTGAEALSGIVAGFGVMFMRYVGKKG